MCILLTNRYFDRIFMPARNFTDWAQNGIQLFLGQSYSIWAILFPLCGNLLLVSLYEVFGRFWWRCWWFIWGQGCKVRFNMTSVTQVASYWKSLVLLLISKLLMIKMWKYLGNYVKGLQKIYWQPFFFLFCKSWTGKSTIWAMLNIVVCKNSILTSMDWRHVWIHYRYNFIMKPLNKFL